MSENCVDLINDSLRVARPELVIFHPARPFRLGNPPDLILTQIFHEFGSESSQGLSCFFWYLLKIYRKRMNVFLAAMEAVSESDKPVEKCGTIQHCNCNSCDSVILKAKRFIVLRFLDSVCLITEEGDKIKALDKHRDKIGRAHV